MLLKQTPQKGALKPQEQQMLNNLKEKVRENWKPLEQKLAEISRETGADGIIQAKQAGILNVHLLGNLVNQEPMIKLDNIDKNNRIDKLMIDFINLITQAISDNSTYPLFDNQTANFIRLAIQEKRLSISDMTIARGKHTVLAGQLLEKLPLFEEATIDEILDIRKELEKPLINFRRAMIEFSEKIKTAAWDQDFGSEVDKIFHQDIAPGILEIEEKVKTTRSLISVADRLLKKPVITGGFLSVALSQASILPELVSIAAFGAGALTATATIVNLIKEIREDQKSTEKNQLYFYYRSGKLLSGN